MSYQPGSHSSHAAHLVRALTLTLAKQYEADMDRSNPDSRPFPPSDRARQAERLVLSGELLVSISHEVNNALQSILGNLQLLQLESLPTAAQEMTEQMLRSSQHMHQLLESMLRLARGDEERRQAELDHVIPTVLELIAPLARERNVTISVGTDRGLVVPLAPHQVQQILLNLLINSIQAFENANGHIWITAHRQAHTVLLAIRDDGPGIQPDIRDRIFEPFFSTKSTNTGTGLGLAIVRSLLQHIGGAITVSDARPGHTTFTVLIPPVAPSSLPREVSSS